MKTDENIRSIRHWSGLHPLCGAVMKEIILLSRGNKKYIKVSENDAVSINRISEPLWWRWNQSVECPCLNDWTQLSALEGSVELRELKDLSQKGHSWIKGGVVHRQRDGAYQECHRYAYTIISRRMTGCYHPCWKHWHSPPPHYMLLEMLYFFSLCVLAELCVATLKSSPVVPRILDTLPQRARHPLPIIACTPVCILTSCCKVEHISEGFTVVQPTVASTRARFAPH
jgi:hypothetical protein